MRNMAFQFTSAQIRSREKTVTRRAGWLFLRPGDRVQAVNRSMGLRKGEKAEKLAVLKIKSVNREPVSSILDYPDDAAREGFPGLTAREFAERFCSLTNCTLTSTVTRIEFEYAD